MSDLVVHPVADLFPMLADDELAELAEDIKQRGLLQPIVLDPVGRVLDGRNRLAACELAGVEPTFETYDGDDPSGYALATNVARRHITKGQISMVVSVALRISTPKTDVNVSPAYLRMANAVRPHEDLAARVIDGTLSLSDAHEEAQRRNRAAEAARASKIRLRDAAPDLLALVDEERMSLGDATAALDAREEKARREEEERRNEEQRRAHEESVARTRDIAAARAIAANLVANFQANVTAIVTGSQLGEPGLVTKRMVVDLRAAVDILEGEL